jgi:hypothetical protein
MEDLGWLTAARVRHITFPLSWRPASIDNGHGAKLPENHANISLSGQNGLLSNGSPHERTVADVLAEAIPSGSEEA